MKKVLVFAIVILIAQTIGCSKKDSSPSMKYEKIRALQILSFGNTMVIFSANSGNTYDITFKDDGTYTKKAWTGNPSPSPTVNGTWVASGNEISMDENNGPTYTLTADAGGFVRDGMSAYINGEAGNVIGLFDELIGTGSGVLDMCYTDLIGKYKVELLGDVATIVLTFDNSQVHIKRDLLSGGNIENSDYSWTCNGYDVLFTKVGTSGPAQDFTKVSDKWWVEGTPINLYFLSDASYVGYMVTNIDYLGE